MGFEFEMNCFCFYCGFDISEMWVMKRTGLRRTEMTRAR
jgi:hypothetical protein